MQVKQETDLIRDVIPVLGAFKAAKDFYAKISVSVSVPAYF